MDLLKNALGCILFTYNSYVNHPKYLKALRSS
jgi:hypothetical protein